MKLTCCQQKTLWETRQWLDSRKSAIADPHKDPRTELFVAVFKITHCHMNSQQSLKSLPWSNAVQVKVVGIFTSRSQTAWMHCFPHALGKVSALPLCYDGLNHLGIIKWKHQLFFFYRCSLPKSETQLITTQKSSPCSDWRAEAKDLSLIESCWQEL